MKCDFLSPSGAGVYEQCPLRYHAKYNIPREERKRTGSTPALMAGSFAHKILEIYYTPKSLVTKEQAFEQAMKEEACSHRGQFEKARKMAFDLIEEEPREEIEVIGTEVNFEFRLPSGAASRGVIDRIDYLSGDSIRLVDYKTGAFVPDIEELIDSHQTNIYPAWVFLNKDFDFVNTVYFNYKYIREGQQKTVVITRDQTDEYLRYFDHLYQTIVNNNNPAPVLNSFCWNCEGRSECWEYNNAINIIIRLKSVAGLGSEKISKIEEITNLSTEEVIDAYSTISTICSCIGKEKDVIKDWITAMLKETSAGAISSDSHTAKLSSRKIKRIDISDAKNIINKHGLHEEIIKYISAGDLEKIVNGNRAAKQDFLDSVIQVDGSKYPTVSKKKGK